MIRWHFPQYYCLWCHVSWWQTDVWPPKGFWDGIRLLPNVSPYASNIWFSLIKLGLSLRARLRSEILLGLCCSYLRWRATWLLAFNSLNDIVKIVDFQITSPLHCSFLSSLLLFSPSISAEPGQEQVQCQSPARAFGSVHSICNCSPFLWAKFYKSPLLLIFGGNACIFAIKSAID